MDLKELKKMIAEEYVSFKRKNNIYEQAPPMPTVNVSDTDIDASGDEDSEQVLKDIFDMLKDYFEGGDDAADAAGDAADDDMEDMDDEKDDINEGACYGEDGKPMPEGHCYEEDGSLKEGYSKSKTSKVLVERFKKLANIIK